MATKKIADLPLPKQEPKNKIEDYYKRLVCPDPEHNPPNYISLGPGIYEHECPTCKKKQTFTVPYTTMSGDQYDDENPDYIKASQEEI